MKKYIVHPGPVVSNVDGHEHWMGFYQLVALYKVNLLECINATYPNELHGINQEEYRHLWPRTDGNYSIPAFPKQS